MPESIATIIEFPLDATSGLELRIAHRRPSPGCEAMSFPNQRLPVYVESRAYVRGNEFVSARLVGPDPIFNFSVEVTMRKSAIAKINKLASRADLPKLGVFQRGAAVQLIQYVRRIPGDVIAWTGFKSAQEARSMLDNLLS